MSIYSDLKENKIIELIGSDNGGTWKILNIDSLWYL